MQIEHKKNTAYSLSFPLVDKTDPSIFRTGDAGGISLTAYYNNGAGWVNYTPAGFASLDEIGNTGVYYIDLTAEDMDYEQVLIKIGNADAGDTAFLFDMRGSVDCLDSQLGDYAHGGAASTLTLSNIVVDATGTTSTAVSVQSDINQLGVLVNATGVAQAVKFAATASQGLNIQSSAETGLYIGGNNPTVPAVNIANQDLGGTGISISGLNSGITTTSIELSGNLDVANFTDFHATGFSTFDPTSDKVTLDNTAHGGAAATFTLTAASYDNFKADVSGLSTFNPAIEKVTLDNTAHGGAAATLTLSDYSSFHADVSGLSTFDPTIEKVFLGDGAHGGLASVLELKQLAIAATDLNADAVKITGNGTGNAITATNDFVVAGDLTVNNFTDFQATIPATQDANLVQINGSTVEVTNLAEFFANTVAEITGVPGVTDKMIEKLKWICHLATYQRVTDSGTNEDRVFNSAGDTPISEATLNDDNTLFTRSAYRAPT